MNSEDIYLNLRLTNYISLLNNFPDRILSSKNDVTLLSVIKINTVNNYSHASQGYCYVMLCYVMLCYVMLCYVMLCYVMLCYVMLCYVMLCYVMLCYVMLCYVMLCYVMLCYVGVYTKSSTVTAWYVAVTQSNFILGFLVRGSTARLSK